MSVVVGSRLARLGGFLAAAALVVPPLLFLPGLKDPFRLPKLVGSEWLGLASLLALAVLLARSASADWRSLFRREVVWAVGPFWLVTSTGFLIGRHPAQFADAWWSLTVGVACVIGWSLGLPRPRATLGIVVFPAWLLSVIGILQFHEVYQPIGFAGVSERFAVTSLAGNVGDLGAYLVVPCLLAAQRLVDRWGGKPVRSPWRIAVWATIFCVLFYGILVTQSLGPLAAVIAGLGVFAFLLLKRRRWTIALGVLLLVTIATLGVEPLRQRVEAKGAALLHGELNEVLTGRLDGWRVAGWLFARHPLLGVGAGGYGAEFSTAKLELMERGVPFYRAHGPYSAFGEAHNEYLEVAAETGILGVAALLFGLFVLVRRLRFGAVGVLDATARALGWALVVAVATLALANFPLRVGLVAYPILAALAWLFSTDWDVAGRWPSER